MKKFIYLIFSLLVFMTVGVFGFNKVYADSLIFEKIIVENEENETYSLEFFTEYRFYDNKIELDFSKVFEGSILLFKISQNTTLIIENTNTDLFFIPYGTYYFEMNTNWEYEVIKINDIDQSEEVYLNLATDESFILYSSLENTFELNLHHNGNYYDTYYQLPKKGELFEDFISSYEPEKLYVYNSNDITEFFEASLSGYLNGYPKYYISDLDKEVFLFKDSDELYLTLEDDLYFFELNSIYISAFLFFESEPEPLTPKIMLSLSQKPNGDIEFDFRGNSQIKDILFADGDNPYNIVKVDMKLDPNGDGPYYQNITFGFAFIQAPSAPKRFYIQHNDINDGEKVFFIGSGKLQNDYDLTTQSTPALTDTWGTNLGPDFIYLLIYVLDEHEPVVSGQTTFVTNIDNQRSVQYFLDYLTAYDDVDGEVAVYVITDNYTPNKSVLGIHTVTVGAIDFSENEATATINIQVVDVTPPVISGTATAVNKSYTSLFNIEAFRQTLTVSDNHSNLTNSNITLKTDGGYTTNYNKLGSYTLVFEAEDASGNKATFNKVINVIDDVAPEFTGPETITSHTNTILTIQDIRSQITAYDFIDGSLTYKIQMTEDNYSGHANQVGNYTIKFSVTDNAGNVATHTVTIIRNDVIAPTIWVVNGSSIKTTAETPLTHQQIIDILIATGELQVNATTTYTFPNDEYSGNEEQEGVYGMTVQARSADGSFRLHDFTITVMASDDGGISVNPIPNWLKDNYLYVILGIIAVAGLLYYFSKRK